MNNSIASVHPELLCEWSNKNFPLTPEKVTFGSNKLIWWQGKCGHEWQASPKCRSRGEQCPICSGTRVVEGINDLATLKPKLVKEWSEKNGKLKPTMVTIGSNKKIVWKGECGHEWIASVKNRALNDTGCPYCSHNAILEGFNDFASQMPNLVKEWSNKNYPLKPSQVTVFANRKVWWKCEQCGYEWQALISSRSSGIGCPCCSGHIFVEGNNDLATTQKELAKEWSNRNMLKPNMINEKSRKRVWWKCEKCGYEWQARIQTRVNGSVCPVCADKKVLKGYNDLLTTNSELLLEWDYKRNTDISPESISKHSMQSVWWRCSFEHSWKEKVFERTNKTRGCPICEREYLSVFPKLIILFYARMYKMDVQINNDDIIGIPLEIYLPEENIAIETYNSNEKMEILKEHLCKKRNIKLIKVPYKVGNDEIEFATKIKKIFCSMHIFITSSEMQDVSLVRKIYFENKTK